MKKILILCTMIMAASLVLAVSVSQPIVHVPADYQSIQDAIDNVSDGGTVYVTANGMGYYVQGLTWSNKHVRLIGINNPVLRVSEHALSLDWSGINHTDQIVGFTFSGGMGIYRGVAMELLNGASPRVTNCTFTGNILSCTNNGGNFDNPYGFGGAVFIQGGSNQINSPVFQNCIFSYNGTDYHGGGAVALFYMKN